MHPYRGIVCTYKCSDGRATRPDEQKHFPRQSAGTNYAPSDPLYGPITWNSDRHGPNYIYGYVYSPARHHNRREQKNIRCYVNRPTIVVSYRPPRAP